MHDFHLGDVDFFGLFLHVFVLELRNFDGVDIFGGGVDGEHFVGVEEVHADGDFVLEVHFSGGGEVFVDLGEEVEVFLGGGDE